VHNSIIATVK